MDAEDMRFADSISRRVHLHAYTRCSLRLIAQKSRLHLLMNQPAATRFYYCRRAILYVSSRKQSYDKMRDHFYQSYSVNKAVE